MIAALDATSAPTAPRSARRFAPAACRLFRRRLRRDPDDVEICADTLIAIHTRRAPTTTRPALPPLGLRHRALHAIDHERRGGRRVFFSLGRRLRRTVQVGRHGLRCRRPPATWNEPWPSLPERTSRAAARPEDRRSGRLPRPAGPRRHVGAR